MKDIVAPNHRQTLSLSLPPSGLNVPFFLNLGILSQLQPPPTEAELTQEKTPFLTDAGSNGYL